MSAPSNPSEPKGPTNIETRLFINGEFVPSKSGKTFDVINPATEKLTASPFEAGAEDVDLAVEAAETALPAWAEMGGLARARYFYKLADLVEKANDEFAQLEAVSMGRPVATNKDGFGCGTIIRSFAGRAADVHGETSLHTPGFVNLTLRQPFGVVGAIIPWNIPVVAAVVKFAPALLAGNTMVLKSSEKAPLAVLALARLIKEAGFPAGTLNILSGLGPVCGAAIASHMEIRKLAFTGSTRTGQAIKKVAATSNLKNVTLELGGKSPLIIFADADLDKAATAAAASILNMSGQTCVASSRVYVEASISDDFTKRLVKVLGEKGANPSGNNPLSHSTVRGPQADKIQFDNIIGFLDEAKEQKLQILTGGGRDGDVGYYIQPTIILNPGEDARVVREEVFGPVQCVSTFESEDEVLKRANDTEYGLFASVFTKDMARALRVSKKFESGMVGVNIAVSFTAMDLPFGGYKGSGDGRELGRQAIESWTEVKTVIIAP